MLSDVFKFIGAKCTVAAIVLFSPVNFAASFDCTQARSDIEHMVCDNPSLSKMDEVINTLYFKAVKVSNSNALKTEQRQWLKQRQDACHTLRYCEQFFTSRITDLIDASHMVKNDLSKGMTYPDVATLDEISASAYQTKFLKESNNPWPRKQLQQHKWIKNLQVATTSDAIYVYFMADGNGETSDQEITLYEYNLLTDEAFKIANVSYYDQYSSNYLRGNQIHYHAIDEKNKQVTEFAYTIGSRVNHAQLNTYTEKFYKQNRVSIYTASMKDRAVAHGKDKLAISSRGMANEIGPNKRAGLDEALLTLSDKVSSIDNVEHYRKVNSIAVYDNTTNDIHIVSKDIMDDWYIQNIVWAPDDSSIYFDNSGTFACIWEYNVASDKLIKIVPEHSAENPVPFTYEEQDYIVYKDQGKLMLAARPH